MSNQIDEIRSRIDIVELVGASGVNLRKAGRSFVGFCPFHPNSRTPAFTVYPDSQSFYCFGCHASGTAFDYVMRKQGLDFKQALEQLAARAGVRLEPKSDQERQEDARKVKLLEINAAAAKYFSYVLASLARAEAGREYVAKRGLTPESVEAFQLGFSLDDWGHLFAYLTEKKGYAPEDVEAAGMAIRSETRGWYDRFRGRLIFPIRNAKGEVVGFGGRALGDAQPKYLNTPETLLFKKGELLYGLDLARDSIRGDDRTVVVEGYVDVITAHQHGFRNVVAPLGTALTKAHVTLLKRLSHNVYLALDADTAGQRATLKGLNALRESAEEYGGGRLVATAQGAVRLESDVNLRIIRMPEGRDPDEVIRGDPELWQRLVVEAAPVMEFYLAAYTTGLDLKNPEDQRQALEKLLPLLAELDGAQQRVYVARIEQVIGIRAELILDLLKGKGNVRASGRSPQKGPKGQGDKGTRGSRDRGIRGRGAATTVHRPFDLPAPLADDEAPHPADIAPPPEVVEEPDDTPAPRFAPRPANPVESYLLALALRHPHVDAAVEALLERDLLTHPAMREIFGGGLEDLLEDTLHQEIWRRYSAAALEQRPASPETLALWIDLLEEPLHSRAAQLIALLVRKGPEEFRYRQEAEQCGRSLREQQIKQFQQRLNQRARAGTPEEIDEIGQLYSRINAYLADVKQPRRSSTFNDLRNTLGRE